MNHWDEQRKAIEEMTEEMNGADEKFGPFTSSHEGYGVLAEEVAELLAAIRTNCEVPIRKEAVQVAAVALRIAISMTRHETMVRSGCRYAEDYA